MPERGVRRAQAIGQLFTCQRGVHAPESSGSFVANGLGVEFQTHTLGPSARKSEHVPLHVNWSLTGLCRRLGLQIENGLLQLRPNLGIAGEILE